MNLSIVRGKKFLKSWLGLSLSLIHTITFAIVIFSKEPIPPPSPQTPCESKPCSNFFEFQPTHIPGVSVIAGRSFEFYYESILYKILYLSSFPSMLIGIIVLGLPVYGLSELSGISEILRSYIFAYIILISSAIQWWCIGAYIHNRVKKRRSIISIR